ncbi:MAG: hypothetical protein ABI200_00435 [Gaiellales bacterium]
MTALAAMTASVDSPLREAGYRSTAQLMHELIALRGTTQPAPEPMLDALRERGLGQLVGVLDERNLRLYAGTSA